MDAKTRKRWRKHALHVLRLEHESGLHYLRSGQIPTGIPTGYILVHNHVPHEADTPVGEDGFRAWMELTTHEPERRVSCDCGWAGLPHYRVNHKVPSNHKAKLLARADAGLPPKNEYEKLCRKIFGIKQ